MANTKKSEETGHTTSETAEKSIIVGVGELGNAIAGAVTTAIEAARPQKKTEFSRKPKTPWTPKDGSPKLKLKRKMYQHNLLIREAFLSNEEISALNQLKPGTYCDGFVKVYRRRDKGINIDYNVKTQDQQMRLVQKFGIRNLTEFCQYCLEEAKNPKKETDSDEFS